LDLSTAVFFCMVTTSRIHHTHLTHKCRSNISGLRGFKRSYLHLVLPLHISPTEEVYGVK